MTVCPSDFPMQREIELFLEKHESLVYLGFQAGGIWRNI